MRIKSIEYNQEDLKFIDSLLAREDFTHNFWNKNTQKKENRPEVLEKPIEKLKIKIKNYYKKNQKYKCPYCYNEYPIDHNLAWWTEHIIPKSKNKLLMFEPLNLCVACIECNKIKANKNVFVDGEKKSLSKKSVDYKIVHPHFDNYLEHIDKNGYFYTAVTNSSKGLETIVMCDLARFISMGLDGEERSSELIDFYDTQKISEEDIDALVAEFADDFL
jgi:hypothetical protein